MKLLKEIEEDFNLFYNNPELYRENVNKISSLLGLEGKSKLREDFLPTYYVGNKNISKPYILFSINPGFNLEQNTKEEALKSGTFENYQSFVENFFPLFFSNGFNSRYFSKLSHFFSGLEEIEFSNKKDYYEFYANNLINIDLIPYHSSTFSMKSKNSEEKKAYLEKRFENILEFIGSLDSKLVIFNGASHRKLLEDYGYLKDLTPTPINEKVNFYTFKIKDISCVLFTWMITSSYSRLSPNDFKYVIPKKLKNYPQDALIFSEETEPLVQKTSNVRENIIDKKEGKKLTLDKEFPLLTVPSSDKDFYTIIRIYILSLSLNMEETPRKNYISYTKNRNTFLSLEPRKTKTLIFLKLNDDKVKKYKSIGEDVREKIHCGNRNFRITLENVKNYNIDLIKEVIRNSYLDI